MILKAYPRTFINSFIGCCSPIFINLRKTIALMYRFLVVCAISILLPGVAPALDATVTRSVSFASADNGVNYRPYLEVSWQVNPRSVHFAKMADGKISGRIRTDIVVKDDKGIINEEHFISQTSPRSTPEELETLTILDTKRLRIAEGKLHLLFRLSDVNDSTAHFDYVDSFEVVIPHGSPYYSDIQLLDTFFTLDAKTPFERNGRQHIPMCADFLGDNKRNLHYYTELNNLRSVPAELYPLVHRVRLAKKKNEAFLADPAVSDTLLTARVPVVLGTFPVGKITSGNYYIVMSLEDRTGRTLCSQARFFQRMNLHPEVSEVPKKAIKEVLADTAMEKITVLDLDKTFLSKYNLAQIKAMLKMLLPQSDPMQTSTINNFLKNPDEMYMRYYLHNYFQSINSKDPGKAWKEYSEKVMAVNKKFSAQGTAGYETERGFIYLRYGAPTDIVTVTNETGTLPYEIWQYNTLTQFSNKKELANALFLFYKSGQMIGDYRLLHSTVPGEMMNSAWRMYLYAKNSASTSAGVNTNSRAEQYFGNR